MKYIWYDRYFTIGYGWSSWRLIRKEVEIVAETETAQKIKYKNWLGLTKEKWVLRDNNDFEKIKEEKNV